MAEPATQPPAPGHRGPMTAKTSPDKAFDTDQTGKPADLEDKSLHNDEVKAANTRPTLTADGNESKPATTSVVIAHFFGDYTPGDVVDLPTWEAERIVGGGLGRFAADEPAED